MELSSFSYQLDKRFIANSPCTPRDHAKLMVVDRKSGTISHKHFFDLESILTPQDVLVLNNTKVFPAKLIGKKVSGGKIELLLLKPLSSLLWSSIYKGNLSHGQKLHFKTCCGVVQKIDGNIAEVLFDNTPVGETPLPPYINPTLSKKSLEERYQTIYAKHSGSVAAPTAGLHFTQELLSNLANRGIQIEFVTLHVGLGTFLPIKTTNLGSHKMHSEYFTLNHQTALKLNKAKKEKKRIIAVGTTTTRVLETLGNLGKLKTDNLSSETNIFIYPPFKFQFIDSLITNFHLPKSTLLTLVSAFVSYPNTKQKFNNFNSSLIGKAYKEALKKNYRFYSFGDAMIII